METAIQMRCVTKTFDKMTAVKDLGLEIPRGGIYGFIGPNGSGKTTSIRMILSIFMPDSGTISVLEHPSVLHAKRRIGYLPEERGIYRKMKVRAFLRYIARLKGFESPKLDLRISEWLERVGLSGIEAKRCDELSKGMSQRVQFVSAVIHRPDLLILDEPFSGLDPVSMRMLRDLILEEHKMGTTVLLSTHVMPQAEDLCEHIIMMYKGGKVLDEPLSTIRSQYDPRAIQFEPLNPAADTTSLMSMPEVERVQCGDGVLKVILRQGSDPAVTMRRIMDAIPVTRIELSRPRLEDVFIQLVSGDMVVDGEEQLHAELQNTKPDQAKT